MKRAFEVQECKEKPPILKGFCIDVHHPNPEVGAVHLARLFERTRFPLPRRLFLGAPARATQCGRSVSLPLPCPIPSSGAALSGMAPLTHYRQHRRARRGRGRPVLPQGHCHRQTETVALSLGQPALVRQCDGDSGQFELCWCCFFTPRTSCRGR